MRTSHFFVHELVLLVIVGEAVTFALMVAFVRPREPNMISARSTTDLSNRPTIPNNE